ncbi:unnamed protein product [Penicillium nalgiovense]|uniref:Uncharacterized protein n=1 Tax=Penicillium nalgiovense TaxID=60175 RepID=A0A9W4HP76_PENNA|nr:unnamed protein product [Penicillium nalgiovense]CAG8025591.1 unnamed protein product [Penicillium nalgiovense]CAG8039248.1 unnamed protein product [Penicillium nalgiovense]CAG8055568.1 unnamed protein product [Penicillium nalgiovense]CAG8059706.1 unnamed protein product [Penicillium nalgiovense]
MSDLERPLAILMQALVKTGLNYICPRCFKLFSDPNACYSHCRKEGDDIHRGLGLITKKDFPEFLRCYRVAIGFQINESVLPLGEGPGHRSYEKCFSVEFVLDNCVANREIIDAMRLAVIKI